MKQRAFLDFTGIGVMEARFYAELGARYPVRLPRCWHAATDGHAYVMVLEDLNASGCTFDSDPRSTIEELAHLHAAFWESPRFDDDLSWVPDRAGFGEGGGKGPAAAAAAGHFIHIALDLFAHEMPPVFRAVGELYATRTADILDLWDEGERTLIHGDPHRGNLFSDNGRTGFYDWAMFSHSPGMRDVAYHLTNSVSTDERRAVEGDLLSHYRHTLAGHGITLDPAHAAQQYRLFTVFSWVSFTSTAAVGQPVAAVGQGDRSHGAGDARRRGLRLDRTAARVARVKVHVMTGASRLPEFQEFARRSADAGFAGLVITESGRTAYLACTAAALSGADLDIATGVAVAFPRSPMVTASVAWELADATGGRFRLGIGPQVRAHVERRYSSEFDPARTPDARVRARAARDLPRLPRRGAAQLRRGVLQALAAAGDVVAGQVALPDPPIDVAAVNPWMLRMTGEHADGVHVHPLNTPTYYRETLLPNLAASGRDLSSFAVYVPLFTAVGDTDEEQARWREASRSMVGFYGSTPNYSFIFDQLGFEGTTDKLRRAEGRRHGRHGRGHLRRPARPLHRRRHVGRAAAAHRRSLQAAHRARRAARALSRRHERAGRRRHVRTLRRRRPPRRAF